MKPSTVLSRIQAARLRRRRLEHLPLLREGPQQDLPWRYANRLGLPVVRTLAQHVAWRLRPTIDDSDASINPFLVRIDRDGILVLPDYLPPDQFALVKEEYERSRTQPRYENYQIAEVGTNCVAEQLDVSSWPEDYPIIKDCFEDNRFIRAIAAAVMRRPVNHPSIVSILVRRRLDPEQPHEDSNSNVLHSDRHYPTVKVFFYLDDVDETNGPYTYAKGSHRLTWARLRHQYDFGNRFALLHSGAAQKIPARLVDRGLNKVDDVHYRAMNIVETPIVGKANTLIISNNMGFHRRGEFKGAQPRVTINMDFNHLASWARPLFPVIRRLPF
jgi:Phytanoyl-CoA dioxygenase (PhyH)